MIYDRRKLLEFFREKGISPSSCVHAAIDLQHKYADGHPDTACRVIGEIAPALRARTIKTYWVYFDEYGGRIPDIAEGTMLSLSCPRLRDAFRKSDLPPGDELLRKESASAFVYTNFETRLEDAGARALVLSGFHFNQCLFQTAYSAIHDHKFGGKVIILTDGTDFDPKASNYKELQDMGVIFTTSQDFAGALDDITADPDFAAMGPKSEKKYTVAAPSLMIV